MNLNFKKYGSGAETLVILHGLFGSLDNWHTLATKFGKKFTVYTIDQRNHGLSPHSDEFDYNILADDLARFMNEHNIEAVTIIGHSMGGKTAMKFAEKYPQKINRLIVVDISPKPYNPGHDVIFDALKAVDLSKVQKRSDADEQLSEEIKEKPVRQFLLKNLTRNDAGGYRWKMNLESLEKNYDKIAGWEKLKEPFKKPTLFINGEKSKYITKEDEALIKEQFPATIIKTIEGAGHWVHAEKPEDFYNAVIGFVIG
jgi:esterase